MTSFRHLCLILCLITSVSVAKSLPDDIEPGDGVNEIELPLNKKSAAELIRIETRGKILAVKEAVIDGRKTFKVKVLHLNGKVKQHLIDAQTGHAPK